ncbi:AzlD domain-containing protein [Pseudonocardia humida]|uniref:AzlD domain-containing protein n=1 Tax=Pseudonocardia humida TaxID=2800819 RepID=A0ABT1A072_9PSEU|nr:AzlD domain-containing protein [Pseudonocardia humida]MCO1656209.1 AzlD domain-containing protein [Pseudonocardia humida]
MIWVLIGVLAVGTLVAKAIGPVLAGGRPLPARLAGVIALVAPALLAALVVIGAFSTQRGIVVDARALGLGAALAALLLRAPLVVALVAAAVVTALARLIV